MIPATIGGDTDTVMIGSDPYTGGATQEDYDQMQSIQQGIDDLKQSHDAAPDGVSPDDSTRPTIPPDIDLKRRRIRAPSLS